MGRKRSLGVTKPWKHELRASDSLVSQSWITHPALAERGNSQVSCWKRKDEICQGLASLLRTGLTYRLMEKEERKREKGRVL